MDIRVAMYDEEGVVIYIFDYRRGEQDYDYAELCMGVSVG